MTSTKKTAQSSLDRVMHQVADATRDAVSTVKAKLHISGKPVVRKAKTAARKSAAAARKSVTAARSAAKRGVSKAAKKVRG